MPDHISPVEIDEELQSCYLDYAMSVIVGRALPSIKDGLKPVHRRILFAMHVLRNSWNQPYKKSARIVGDVIGKYHPHGDVAVYEALARFAQDFSLRYPLADGQGNFGSMDGDNPAAMRYTEIRMARIAHSLLDDLDKETVAFTDNYDGSEQIPEVLPAKFPNLLVNGANGIAVGVATFIPPHNLNEVCNAALAMIDDPNISVEGLMQHVTGPDFPTGGIINGIGGARQAYQTGGGIIRLRARATVEPSDTGSRERIIISEMPYMVKKAELIEKIGHKVRDKEIVGISEIRDESNKQGVRVVIECKRGEDGAIVLNNLWKKTDLERSIGMNLVALDGGQPVRVNLHRILEAWINHRKEVVLRRSDYLLREALRSGHRLEGMALALANIDEVLELIRKAADRQEVCEFLCGRTWPLGNVKAMIERATELCIPADLDEEEVGLVGDAVNLPLSEIQEQHQYRMSRIQAEAIADMRLHRLTNLEQQKLRDDYQEVLLEVVDLRDILDSQERLISVIKEEIEQVKADFGDERRTDIVASELDLTNEDLITPEDRILTISSRGYAKSQAATDYRAQRRGGVGRAASGVRDEDYIEQILVANTHSPILFFTNFGRVFKMKLLEIVPSSHGQRGRPIQNMLKLQDGERVTNMMALGEKDEAGFIFMATASGVVKKTEVSQFLKVRSNGLIALNLKEGDELIGAALSDGAQDIMLVTREGLANRFNESEVRSMGRTATGVRGIKVKGDNRVIAMLIPPSEEAEVLFCTEHGYGKRVAFGHFNTKHRGTQGNICMPTQGRNGVLVTALLADSEHDLALITSAGKMIRMPIEHIGVMGRQAMGVRVQRLSDDGETLIGGAIIAEPSDIDDAIDPDIDPDEASAETNQEMNSETNSEPKPE